MIPKSFRLKARHFLIRGILFIPVLAATQSTYFIEDNKTVNRLEAERQPVTAGIQH